LWLNGTGWVRTTLTSGQVIRAEDDDQQQAEHADDDDCAKDRDLGNHICAAMKDLWHALRETADASLRLSASAYYRLAACGSTSSQRDQVSERREAADDAGSVANRFVERIKLRRDARSTSIAIVSGLTRLTSTSELHQGAASSSGN